MALGFAPAALPSWDIFMLFARHSEQLKPILATTQISEHLLRLADLYKPVSPALEDWCIVTASSGFHDVTGTSDTCCL